MVTLYYRGQNSIIIKSALYEVSKVHIILDHEFITDDPSQGERDVQILTTECQTHNYTNSKARDNIIKL